MSLALDGRLPSGRRAALMDEIARCDDCAALWEQMQAAHDLALSARPVRVSAHFRAGLAERIRSGEAAPEVAFREETPALARVRYVLTGAAAAAAFLFALNAWRGAGRPAPAGSHEEIASIADHSPPATGDPSADPAGAAVGSPAAAATTAGQALPPVMQLTPFSVASSIPQTCATSWQNLKQRLSSMGSSAAVDAWPQVQSMCRDVEPNIEAVNWLQSVQVVTLSRSVLDELVKAEDTLSLVFSARSRTDRSEAVQRLQRVRLELLRHKNGYTIACCKDPREFTADFRELVVRNRDVLRLLRNVVVMPPGLLDGPGLFLTVPPSGRSVGQRQRDEVRFMIEIHPEAPPAADDGPR